MESKKEILNRISDTLDKILIVLEKPEHRLLKIFDIGAAIITILSIVIIIDIIRIWILGG